MNIYVLSKIIHRWLVGLLTALGVIVAISGLILEEEDLTSFFSIDRGLIKELHVQFGVYLAYLLLAMIVTGLVLYFYPYYQKAKRAKMSDKTDVNTIQQ